MEVLLTILIVFCVEVFFASRVWLCKSLTLIIIVGLLKAFTVKQFHWTVPLAIILSALGAVGNDSELFVWSNLQLIEILSSKQLQDWQQL